MQKERDKMKRMGEIKKREELIERPGLRKKQRERERERERERFCFI